jgi:Phage P22-like portal protein
MAKAIPPKTNLDKAIMADMDETEHRLILQARHRFTKTSTNWSEIRRESVNDQKFFAGEHYDDAAARAARARGGAPQIKVNMLPNFVQQIENNLRQQNIGINVHATDEQGSEEDAEIRQGLIRHIEHISNAKQAYLWAAGSHGALVPGFGFIKLETDYTGPKSFDQEIYIRGVKDPMKILPDFNAEMPDFSDAEYWFEFEQMDKDTYNEKYSGSKLNQPTWADWNALGKTIGMDWIKKSQVTIAKYWYRDTTIRHYAAFEDGSFGYLDEYGMELDSDGKAKVVDASLADNAPRVELTAEEIAENRRAYDALGDSGTPDQYPITEGMGPVDRLANVIKFREEVTHEVKWIVTNGFEILDSGEWHDSEFPFVGFVGKDQIIDGKRDIHGIVRYAKDPQKMYNYFTSQIVRRVDAANKSAWLASLESIPEPQRRRWETSNVDDPAILYYQAYDSEGKPLAPPARGDSIEPAIQMFMAGAQKFNQDIKSTVGIFEAGLGQGIGDRQSGDAIDSLAQRGEMNNLHYADNVVLSMKRLGCLILRLIPKIYDTARTVRIMGLDDENDLVKINQMFTEGGQSKMHDMSKGAYDVVIDTGPTFATKKAQQTESMLKFGAIEPAMMPFIADLLVGNMDWDTAGVMKDRIQQVQAAQYPWLHAQDGQQNLPPQAKIAIQNLQKQLQASQQAGQHVQQLYAQEKMKNDTNLIAHQAKTQQLYMSQMFELRKQQNKLIAESQSAKDKLQLERVKAELNHVNQRIDHTMQAWSLVNDASSQVTDTAQRSLIATSATGQQGPAPQAALPPPAQPAPTQAQPGQQSPQSPQSLTPGLGGPLIQQ